MKQVKFNNYHKVRTFTITSYTFQLGKEIKEKINYKYSRECKTPTPASKRKKSPPKKVTSKKLTSK
jgi:hypothetical protein